MAAVPVANDLSQVLEQADRIKTSNHVEFVELLQQLDRQEMQLSLQQQWYLRYLDAWQVAYKGDYESATSRLNAIIDQSADETLRFRATATLINILGIGHHYEDAFTQLSQMLEQLPQITDKRARFQGLGEAAQLLIAAEQYDLAVGYADQMLQVIPPGESPCKALFFKFNAGYFNSKQQALDPKFQTGIDVCVKAGEPLVANTLRADLASFDIKQGHTADAIELLERNGADVQRDQYPSLISQFDVLLAQAYWKQGEAVQAKKFAMDTISASIKGQYTEPLRKAYGLLYQVDKQQGHLQSALAYHEKYMAADKAYLDDVSAKALAYQIVKQQVQAKKQQVDKLNNQNQILQLQQALDRKAVEAGRLYIGLLLMVLAFIGLWLYRLKRSQLRFMNLARRDGLTGIFNRQHFVSEAELALRYAKKSARGACLILIDLDHFKLINDTYGHAVGDQVLKRVVTVCEKHLRSTDIFGRLGGEEFGILLPECQLDQVVDRAEKIRSEIAARSLDENPSGIAISASFGATSTDRSGYELRQLLVDADDALYRAKDAGRNCVVFGKTDDDLVTS
ncbi:MAG: GGDEF domain-containing protein [Rhodanobacter sp.]